MRHFGFAVFLTLVFTAQFFAQGFAEQTPSAETENSKTATKLDEFGRAGDCDLGARVDNFFIQLNDDLQAKGYIIVYNSVDMTPSDRENYPMLARIRRAMAFRKYDESRVTIIKGGFRDSASTELFLVPPGAEPPEPTDTVLEPERPKGTFLWSKGYLQIDDNGDYINTLIRADVKAKEEEEARVDELQAKLEAANDPNARNSDDADPATVEPDETEYDDGLTQEEREDIKFAWADERFANEIAKRKGSRGVIIFYIDDEYLDVARVQQYVEEGRDRIAASAKIPASKISVVFGGYGDMGELEFHIVSRGSKDPVPTPRERPVPDYSN